MVIASFETSYKASYQLAASKTTEENQLLTTESKEASYESSYKALTDQKDKA